ncbi:MAG: uridine phosphorylase, partial [Thermoplasmata archaeon]
SEFVERGGEVEKIGENSDYVLKREYKTMTCKIDGERVSCTSTGIGGPATSIAVEELMQIGAHTLIRVGSTGAIHKNIRLGDVIITSAAVRLDGASGHYAPLEYPPIALLALIEAADRLSKGKAWTYHVGITVASDTFYPGQCREDSFSGYVPLRFKGTFEEWQRLNVLNYEMESATLYTMGNALGARAGCVLGVIVNRQTGETPDASKVDEYTKRAVEVGVEATRTLIKWDKEQKIELSIENKWTPNNLLCKKLLEKYKARNRK